MQEKGAIIPDYVIDDRVQTIIREEFGGDRAAFIRTLQAQGFNAGTDHNWPEAYLQRGGGAGCKHERIWHH